MYFNPRSHARSDDLQTYSDHKHKNFNPRSHARSDVGYKLTDLMDMEISIHAPTQGATCDSNMAKILDGFQSTLPRKERHRPAHTLCFSCPISIHAPTQGATPVTIAVIADDTISIHAPTQGATGGADTNVCRFADFNPRSHARSDAM